MRPFYLWKEGFIDNYLKLVQGPRSKDHEKKELNLTFQGGFFDVKRFLKTNSPQGRRLDLNEEENRMK